jgi:hypothetical protein
MVLSSTTTSSSSPNQKIAISESKHDKPSGTAKIRAAMNFLQNARIILCTDYIAKDLQNVIEAGVE